MFERAGINKHSEISRLQNQSCECRWFPVDTLTSLFSWLEGVNDVPLCQINVTVVSCCGRPRATHFLWGSARAEERTPAMKMSNKKVEARGT